MMGESYQAVLANLSDQNLPDANTLRQTYLALGSTGCYAGIGQRRDYLDKAHLLPDSRLPTRPSQDNILARTQELYSKSGPTTNNTTVFAQDQLAQLLLYKS